MSSVNLFNSLLDVCKRLSTPSNKENPLSMSDYCKKGPIKETAAFLSLEAQGASKIPVSEITQVLKTDSQIRQKAAETMGTVGGQMLLHGSSVANLKRDGLVQKLSKAEDISDAEALEKIKRMLNPPRCA